MLKRYFILILLGFLTVFAYLAADLFTFTLRQKLERQATTADTSAPETKPKVAPLRAPRTIDKMQILARNIFNSQVSALPAPVASEGEAGEEVEIDPNAAVKSTLPVRLVGIAYGDPALACAFIEDGGMQDIYLVDDMVKSTARIVSIEETRVILNNNGKSEYLELDLNEIKTSPRDNVEPGGRRKSGPSRGAKEAPPGEGASSNVVLSKQEVQSAMENMGQLMTKIRLIPNLSQGKTDGFRALDIRKGSLFETMGLLNGDIIKRVNGMVLDKPEKGLGLYEQIRDETSLDLDIVRRGQSMHLHYDVR